MSPREEFEKKLVRLEPGKGSDLTRSGLERRLHATQSERRPYQKLSISDLKDAAKQLKSKFTIAELNLLEFEFLARSKSIEAAETLANEIFAEIVALLRQNDLVSQVHDGKFLVLLPEAGPAESTMILDRLAREVCKKHPERASLPQISLTRKFLNPDNLSNYEQPSLKNEEAQQWLIRYGASSFNELSKNTDTNDLWEKNRQVIIKKIDIGRVLEKNECDHLQLVLTAIQSNMLPLFPQLYDFYFGESFVALVVEPAKSLPKDFKRSTKLVHDLLIAVCDYVIFCDSQNPSIDAPDLMNANFAISSQQLPILQSIEEHLIKGVCQNKKDKANSSQKIAMLDMTSIKALIEGIAKENAEDECFKFTDIGLQKFRAALKRHEEKLRRGQSGNEDISKGKS